MPASVGFPLREVSFLSLPDTMGTVEAGGGGQHHSPCSGDGCWDGSVPAQYEHTCYSFSHPVTSICGRLEECACGQVGFSQWDLSV